MWLTGAALRHEHEGIPEVSFWRGPPISYRQGTGGVGGRALVNGQGQSGREGGHRLRASYSSHPPKVAWELVG